jgi:hypothetical protein
VSRRRRVPWISLLAGALVGVAALAVAVVGATRTSWGRVKVLELTLGIVGGRLNGELRVARLEGNLLTGARVYGVVIRQPDGRVLVQADSAYIDYRLASFIGGDMVIRRLDLFQPSIFLRRLPTDSLWNYQQLLLDTTRTATGPGRATLIDRVRLVRANVKVEVPWLPTAGLPPAERRAEIRAALSDTSRLMVARAPGGYLRTVLLSARSAAASRVTIAPEQRGGTYVRVDGLVGRLSMYRGVPLELRGLRGELEQRAGIVRYRAPYVQLPSSRVASEGTVDLSGEMPVYNVTVEGTGVALRDAQWLYPPFPREGTATFRLALQTLPYGDYYRMDTLRLTMPGTRLAGHFGIVVGDTLVFDEVALRADPLDVSSIEEMLPATVPVRGLRIGSMEILTPVS